ncbi:THAP domain-containing protein 5-like isoform X2 [Pristis pectinata]|uniref:THAP domain-containing protein 5-like isoform X2 n=1 Tax=Pristis pectinata TaxID=685728 RepID=UPI00223E53D3|nr:THAP domain-containing protein 5-like isoform X2 [Pristis pectinata]
MAFKYEKGEMGSIPVQYICSEHLLLKALNGGWGTRYLKADAVPTIFSFPEQPTKRRAVARSNGNKRQKKRLEAQSNEEEPLQQKQTVPVQSPALTEPNALTVLTLPTESTCLTEAAASTSVTEFDKVIISSVDPCDESISETITPSTTSLPSVAANSFGSLQIAKDGPSQTLLEEQSVLPFENVAAIETVQLASTLASIDTVGATAMMPSVETLQFTPMQACDEPESTFTSIEIVLPAQDQQDIETLSSFQQEPPTPVLSTIATPAFENVTALAVESTSQVLSPTNLSSQTSHLLTAATEPLKSVSAFETVLTLPSTLIVPIMSTLPVVQSHAAIPPEPIIAAVETVMTTQSDTQEVQGEHSYYKNDLTIEQLEEIVASLQKKVKVIQQRERRNSARLKAMENLVNQLKKENVISEEKLKIMEMTCSQTTAQVMNTSSTVTVTCEDNGNIIYTLQQPPIEECDHVL